MAKAKTIVKVEELTKRYNAHPAVDHISFKVEKGEIFGILGPNGAGKTSTLEMIEALRTIDSGTIEVDGINVKKDPNAIKEIIGLQLQSSAFYDKISLDDLLKLFGSFYGLKVNTKDLLGKVELSEKHSSYVEHLSGGQKQRFSIATALVNNPKVLFLDEPTTGLDPQARRHVWELIQKIRDHGVTIVLTTHYMEEAELLCDRVAIMDGGKIIAIDSPDNMVKKLLKSGFKKKVEVKQANLEDVFIDLTGKALRE